MCRLESKCLHALTPSAQPCMSQRHCGVIEVLSLTTYSSQRPNFSHSPSPNSKLDIVHLGDWGKDEVAMGYVGESKGVRMPGSDHGCSMLGPYRAAWVKPRSWACICHCTGCAKSILFLLKEGDTFPNVQKLVGAWALHYMPPLLFLHLNKLYNFCCVLGFKKTNSERPMLMLPKALKT